MDRQRIEGGLKKATGSIKEQAGKAVGDRHLEGEGKAEKTDGCDPRRGRERVTRAANLSHDEKAPPGQRRGGASLCGHSAGPLVSADLSTKGVRERFRVCRGLELQGEDRTASYQG